MQITIPAADMRPQDLAEIRAIHEPRNGKTADELVIGKCPFCDDGLAGFDWTGEAEECAVCGGTGSITAAELDSLHDRLTAAHDELAMLTILAREGDFGAMCDVLGIAELELDPQDAAQGAD